MLSYQIREYYEFALKELEKIEKSISILFEYEEKYQKISSNTLIQILALSSKNTHNSSSYSYTSGDGSLIDVFNKCNIELISKFNLLTAFGDFSTYKNNINIYKLNNNITDSDADSLIEQIESLFDSYHNYIRNQNDKSKAVIFIQKLFTFKGYFNAVKNSYINLLNMFNSIPNEEYEETNCSIMEIQLLKVEFTFEQFISHLSSIRKIYSELGQVICKENTAPPLKIVKIESGSLLAKIFGDANVLEALGLLLKKTINLCFGKFTKDGQMNMNSEVKKQIVEDINLRNELIRLGFDVTSSDQNISKAFELVTKETMRLAEDTPKFKIDDEVIECGEFNGQKYIEANRTKLLTEKSESEENVQENNPDEID